MVIVQQYYRATLPGSGGIFSERRGRIRHKARQFSFPLLSPATLKIYVSLWKISRNVARQAQKVFCGPTSIYNRPWEAAQRSLFARNNGGALDENVENSSGFNVDRCHARDVALLSSGLDGGIAAVQQPP